MVNEPETLHGPLCAIWTVVDPLILCTTYWQICNRGDACTEGSYWFARDAVDMQRIGPGKAWLFVIAEVHSPSALLPELGERKREADKS